MGVSDCPLAPNLKPLPQCANSASDFSYYLMNKLRLPRKDLLYLFDSDLPADSQLRIVENWLSQHQVTDLVFYYTGHGSFTRPDRSYFLATRQTRAKSEGSSSIRFVDLAGVLQRFVKVRRFIILDCCFAASAVHTFQSDVSHMMADAVEKALPRRGTAFLCSSSATSESIAKPNERHTMFSGAFLDCLEAGADSSDEWMTLSYIGERTRELIEERHPDDAIHPQVHSPEQDHGQSAAYVPLFPNPNFRQYQPRPPPARPPRSRRPPPPPPPPDQPISWYRRPARTIVPLLAIMSISSFAIYSVRSYREINIEITSARVILNKGDRQGYLRYTLTKNFTEHADCFQEMSFDQIGSVTNVPEQSKNDSTFTLMDKVTDVLGIFDSSENRGFDRTNLIVNCEIKGQREIKLQRRIPWLQR